MPGWEFTAPDSFSWGATELLYASTGGLTDLDVDESGVYVLHGAGVERIPRAGGPPTHLHDEGGGDSLVLRGGRVFWSANDAEQGVFSVRTDGTDAQHHYDGRVRHRIAVDDTHIYLSTESGAVLAQPWPGTGAPVTVGQDPCPTDLYVDPLGVFLGGWYDPAGDSGWIGFVARP